MQDYIGVNSCDSCHERTRVRIFHHPQTGEDVLAICKKCDPRAFRAISLPARSSHRPTRAASRSTKSGKVTL